MYKYDEYREKKSTLTYLDHPIPFQDTRNHYSMREPFEWFLLETGLTQLKCAEIGVADGENAWSFISNMDIAEAWLVDTWGHALDPNDPDSQLLGRTHADWTEMYNMVADRFKDHPGVNLVRMWAEEADKVVPHELDFIYLDASHDYADLVKDIQVWLPHVRTGGWLMGDDYTGGGIMKATQEFSIANHIDLRASSTPTQWWFVKDRDTNQYVLPKEWL